MKLLKQWRESEKDALELAKICGDLKFDHSIDLVLFRDDLYDLGPSEIINLHQKAMKFCHCSMDVQNTLALAKGIASIAALSPARIDLGRLILEWDNSLDKSMDAEAFGASTVQSFLAENRFDLNSRDVVLYGFGRIGRLVARRMVQSTGRGEQLRLKAIVLRQKMKTVKEELEKRASLMAFDSVHGAFKGVVAVDVDQQALIINGNVVKVIFANAPTEIDYTEFEIDQALVIDNTGMWRDQEALRTHMRPGVAQVMLTAPGKGIPNIVYGVNHEDLQVTTDPIFCAASCTTNAIVPIIKCLDDAFTISKGHIETIHAYTSDQNLLDNFHKKPRRGQAAAINMVLTTTGAGAAVSKVFPHLAGKLTGNAVRVPVPNVSLAILAISIEKPVTVEAVKALLKQASLYGDLSEQIRFSESDEFVSSYAIGSISTSVVDSPSIKVSQDGKHIIVYAWYDNEYGYSCQVVRLAKHSLGVRRPCYY